MIINVDDINFKLIGENVINSIFSLDEYNIDISADTIQELCDTYGTDDISYLSESSSASLSKFGLGGTANGKINKAGKDIVNVLKTDGANKESKKKIHTIISELFEELAHDIGTVRKFEDGKIKEFGLDGYSDSEAKPYTFANGDEMLSTLKEGIDLYNPEDELFVFLYNDAGSICSYRIDPKEAAELAKLAAEPEGECWSGFLGIGGSIFDDPHYENYNPKLPNNIDFCREHYRGSWFDTSIFKG